MSVTAPEHAAGLRHGLPPRAASVFDALTLGATYPSASAGQDRSLPPGPMTASRDGDERLAGLAYLAFLFRFRVPLRLGAFGQALRRRPVEVSAPDR